MSLPTYPKEVPSSPGINYDKPHGAGMPYNYNWAVADTDAGLNYGQQENSDGSVVTGEYRVLLPDGRTQIVRYRADHESGYGGVGRGEVICGSGPAGLPCNSLTHQTVEIS